MPIELRDIVAGVVTIEKDCAICGFNMQYEIHFPIYNGSAHDPGSFCPTCKDRLKSVIIKDEQIQNLM